MLDILVAVINNGVVNIFQSLVSIFIKGCVRYTVSSAMNVYINYYNNLVWI